MAKQSLIKAFRFTVAAGYLAGAVGSAVASVHGDNRTFALMVAVPAVLQGIEAAAWWASKAGGVEGRGRAGDHRPPER